MKRSSPGSPWTAHASVDWDRAQPPQAGEVQSPEALTELIESLTEAITGAEHETFSTHSIVIRVSSPDTPDLTLIDLPGIVRTTTSGQSSQVITSVNSMIEHFIAQENTVILAVIPANQDIATVDILERAARVDPTGERTLGVITKPDLVDRGAESEVVATINNKRKPLRMGYICIKNPSQREMEMDGMNRERGNELERAFFEKHTHFCPPNVPAHLLGVHNLCEKLTTILVGRIKSCIPSLKWEVKFQIDQTKEEISELNGTYGEDLLGDRHNLFGSSASDDDEDDDEEDDDDEDEGPMSSLSFGNRFGSAAMYGFGLDGQSGLPSSIGGSSASFLNSAKYDAVLMKLVLEFSSVMRESMRGEYQHHLLTTAASNRLHYHYQVLYRSFKSMVWLSKPSNVINGRDFVSVLEEDIVGMRGRELPGFMNTQVFYSYVVSFVEAWRGHVEELCRSVRDTTQRTCEDLLEQVVGQFPNLKQEIFNLVDDLTTELFDKLTASTNHVLQLESDPFTANDHMYEVINQIRFQKFDHTLKQTVDRVMGNTKSSSSGESSDERTREQVIHDIKRDPLCMTMVRELGSWYLQNHGVSKRGNAEEMKTLIQAYWNVASRRMVDHICMTVETDFCSSLADELESRAVVFVSMCDDSEALLEESKEIAQKRTFLKDKLKRLKKADKIMRVRAPEIIPREPESYARLRKMKEAYEEAANDNNDNERNTYNQDELDSMYEEEKKARNANFYQRQQQQQSGSGEPSHTSALYSTYMVTSHPNQQHQQPRNNALFNRSQHENDMQKRRQYMQQPPQQQPQQQPRQQQPQQPQQQQPQQQLISRPIPQPSSTLPRFNPNKSSVRPIPSSSSSYQPVQQQQQQPSYGQPPSSYQPQPVQTQQQQQPSSDSQDLQYVDPRTSRGPPSRGPPSSVLRTPQNTFSRGPPSSIPSYSTSSGSRVVQEPEPVQQPVQQQPVRRPQSIFDDSSSRTKQQEDELFSEPRSTRSPSNSSNRTKKVSNAGSLGLYDNNDLLGGTEALTGRKTSSAKKGLFDDDADTSSSSSSSSNRGTFKHMVAKNVVQSYGEDSGLNLSEEQVDSISDTITSIEPPTREQVQQTAKVMEDGAKFLQSVSGRSPSSSSSDAKKSSGFDDPLSGLL